MFADLPPQLHERVTCSIQAAAQYQIPANILLAVAEAEGGKPGQWVENTNGTHDVGVMQFNTAYIKTLKHHGITPAAVAVPGCYPYLLAAWRLALHISNDQGDIWKRAANYHSRTPEHNQRYRARLIRFGAKWEKWLDRRFKTVSMSPGHTPKQSGTPPTKK